MVTMTSRVGEIVSALHARLTARPALVDVTIHTYVQAPSKLAEADDYITIVNRIVGAQRFPYATKTIKHDNFSIEGEIICLEPGAGDETAQVAMDRALSYLAEIEDELRTDPSLGFPRMVVAKLTDYEHLYAANDRGRLHGLRYTIEVDAEMVSN